ncbi:hypothetical protein HAX54_024706 [Datura stramonium]|uniref:F-box domain-containing protein n=1 Tax=Datura stramonium TaxID=4076 RepID=A0ABS8RH23_DATST|nr:hypothetical protein [Datura stramonium]
MNYFDRLPEGCICEIISHTTPADAVRATILSKEFKFVGESDEIWEKFLPSDYQEIIDRCEFPPVYNTKKELFFSLCDSPILLDGGKLSFFLDKHSGKKCFMIASRELTISRSGNTNYWKWKKNSNLRFSEAACQGALRLLDINGRIGTEMLSPKTDYAAYLVFKLAAITDGLDYANSTIIRFLNYQYKIEIDKQAITGKLEPLPKMRGDGWMEVELGYFNSREGSDGPVEARFINIKSLYYKGGLIIEGIEFRPKGTTSAVVVADIGF